MLSNHDREILGTAANYLEKILAVQTNNIVSAIKSLKEETVVNKTEDEYVKTNLNLYIKVKLTEHGKEVHREYWEPICRDCGHEYKYPEVDEYGYSSF